MKTMIILIFSMGTVIACTQLPQPLGDSMVHLNQLGFFPDAGKEFIVENPTTLNFEVIDTVTDKPVFSGTLETPVSWELAGKEPFAKGTFSEVTQKGKYKIRTGDVESYEFVIQDDIYSDVLKASIKSYYYQRCSQELKEIHAGMWARAAGHPDTKLSFHESMNREGTLDSPGGWYDAGDYGKYVVNAGITMLTLMTAWELNPGRLSVSLNIPRQKSVPENVPDFILELKYELDWLKTMQDGDGGVFFKIGPLQFPGMIRPEADKRKRYVIGKSTTSTLNFAAVMAKAGRVLSSWFPDYSADCIKRAVSAFDWAKTHPDAAVPIENGGTGSYGDQEYKDEFLTAAAELYLATKNNEFKEYVADNIKSFTFSKPASWDYISNFAFFEVVLNKNQFEEEIYRFAKNEIIKFGDIILERIESNIFSIPLLEEDFIWGSNSVILNYGMAAAIASRITEEKTYADVLPLFLDYIFGKNPTGYSFVTGFGKSSPMFIHYRPSAGDKIKEPVPGFLVGGPNKDMQDGKANYTRIEPARAYTDVTASFASNEVAINWNAVLVFMLVMYQAG